MHQTSIMSYWVIEAYDPAVDQFVEVFKSYGLDVANQKMFEYLKEGVCAIVKHKTLPMI